MPRLLYKVQRTLQTTNKIIWQIVKLILILAVGAIALALLSGSLAGISDMFLSVG